MTAIIARSPASAKSAPLAVQQPAPAHDEAIARGEQGEVVSTPNQSYSRAQFVSVLEVIAGNMATLDSILAMALTSDGEWEKSNLISAAQAIVQSVGCVADHAAGDSVIGDIGRWHCGPSFHDQGAEQ